MNIHLNDITLSKENDRVSLQYIGKDVIEISDSGKIRFTEYAYNMSLGELNEHRGTGDVSVIVDLKAFEEVFGVKSYKC